MTARSIRLGWRFVAPVLLLTGMAFGQTQPPQPSRPGRYHAPYLNLAEGRTVASRYSGASAATGALRGGQTRALSSTVGDFDEDGMPDLASGFATSGGAGIVTVHRGNVDALWPYGALRGANPPAFLPDARVFALPEAPDFLAAGDFDADGHWDIAAARAGSAFLYWLKGDGHGGFAEAQRIALPGAVTAMTSGDINRADGLTDLMIAVTGESGSQVLVFESPAGALRGQPEVFQLPAPATSLAVMALDGGIMNGLAVAAGQDLLLIHGRDRKLTRPKADRDSVPAATITRQHFEFALQSLAVGNFSSRTLDLAALGDDGQIHILERSDANRSMASKKQFSIALPAGSGAPGRGSAVAPAIDRPSGPVSAHPETTGLTLRSAIALPSSVRSAGARARLVTARVASTGRDSLIVIDPAGKQLHVVSHASRDAAAEMAVSASLDVAAGPPAAVQAMRIDKQPLHGLVVLAEPQIEPVTYDTQPDFVLVVTNTSDDLLTAYSLRNLINFASALTGTVEIDFNIPLTDPNRNPITGVFTIQPVFQNAMEALPTLGGTLTIDGYTQPGASPNTLSNGSNAQPLVEINGSMAGSGPSGLSLFGAATIRGLVLTNFVQAPIPGADGTSHGGAGIDIESSGNFIEGNFIGIDATGSFAKPNYLGIISFGGENGNMIGGTAPAARNLISGNTYVDIGLQQAAVPNAYFIQGNQIGTNNTGSNAVGDILGVVGLEGLNAVMGGTTAGTRNVVAGNANQVDLEMGCSDCLPATGNLVQGNYLGTDPTGVSRPQFTAGDSVAAVVANGDTIGGTTPAARNIMAAPEQGVFLAGGSENILVEGNYIGVNVTGTQALGSIVFPGVLVGISYYDTGGGYHAGAPCTNNTIGGEAPGAGNVISGNGGGGISITNASTNFQQGNVIAGNLIGTDASGLNPIPNNGDGISMSAYAGGNTVGGTDAPAANVIAYNTGNGVTIDPGQANSNDSVIGNAIYSNGGTGVRIPSGTGNMVSANSIYSNGALGIDIDAAGVLTNSACQASTNGANLLQNAPVLTAGSGSAFVSATATDPNGNTSEFSNCVAASLTGGVLNIAGTLNSKPSTTYTIQYFSNASCDASGYGQGKVYLGSSKVTTPSSCSAAIGGTLNLANADLAVTETTADGATAYVAFTFASVVTNSGPATAGGAVWTDVLPAGFNFLSATSTQGTCGLSGSTITCNLGNVPVGGTATITVNVVPTALGNFSNTVSVTSSTNDPNIANNSATLSQSTGYGPLLDHLTPASAPADSPALSLTVVGQGFMPNSVVTFNGTAYTATFNGNWNPSDCGTPYYRGSANYCTALTITVPAAQLTTQGTPQVTVNSAYDRTGHAYLWFYVNAPLPGPVARLVLSVFGGSNTTWAAGTPEILDITAVDANGVTVTTYTGTVNLTSTDPAPGVFTTGGGSASVTVTASEEGVGDTIVALQTFGQQYITATDASNPAITGTLGPIAVGNGPAADLTLTGTPQATPPGQRFAQPLSVTVTDLFGNAVPGQLVTFTPPASGASCTLSSLTATTNSAGMASVTATANSVSGTYTVGVTYGPGFAGGGPNADVFLLNNGTGLATLTATGGTPQSTFIGQLFKTNLQATLLDGLGNPISGATVWFSSPFVGGPNGYTEVVVPGSAVTNASGVVSVEANAAANGPAGLYPTTATAGGLTATFALTVNTPEPVVMTIQAGSPQSTPVGYPFPTPLTVLVTDGWGTPRPGVVVTFVPPTSGASATVSPGIASTNASGIATLTTTANSTVGGPYNVAASVGDVTVNFALTNTPVPTGPPASIAATAGTPQSAIVNQAFGTLMQVVVKNAGGAPLPGVSVTFTAPASGASGTFTGSATVTTNGQGLATAPAFTANGVAGTYTVTAAAGTLSATFALTNTGGTPAAMNIYAGNNQNAAVNTAFATPLAVQLVDASGNPSGAGWGVIYGVVAGSSGASGTFGGATSVTTNSSGVATAPALTANGTTGGFSPYAIAFVGSTYYYQTFSLTNVAAAPAAVTATGGTPQSTPTGAAFPAALSAKVTDSSGNAISGVTVTFSAPTTGASATLSAATATTNSSGIASVTATANATAGSYTVTASAGAFNASFSLTNTAPSPAAIASTGGTPQSTNAGKAFGAALSVKVTDSGGNPISGVTVTFSAPTTGAGATLSAASAVTNSSGIASVTATANSTLGSYSVTAAVGSLSTRFALTNDSKCDINLDGQINVVDVQLIINEALGVAPAVNDLNGDGVVNVVDVQIVINAALGLGCSAT